MSYALRLKCFSHPIRINVVSFTIWQGGWSYPLNRLLRSHDLTLFVIFVQCYSVLRRAILFNKVFVIRQLGKILIYRTTQLFKL